MAPGAGAGAFLRPNERVRRFCFSTGAVAGCPGAEKGSKSRVAAEDATVAPCVPGQFGSSSSSSSCRRSLRFRPARKPPFRNMYGVLRGGECRGEPPTAHAKSERAVLLPTRKSSRPVPVITPREAYRPPGDRPPEKKNCFFSGGPSPAKPPSRDFLPVRVQDSATTGGSEPRYLPLLALRLPCLALRLPCRVSYSPRLALHRDRLALPPGGLH